MFRVRFCAQWRLGAELVFLNGVACVCAGVSPFVVSMRCGSAVAVPCGSLPMSSARFFPQFQSNKPQDGTCSSPSTDSVVTESRKAERNDNDSPPHHVPSEDPFFVGNPVSPFSAVFLD